MSALPTPLAVVVVMVVGNEKCATLSSVSVWVSAVFFSFSRRESLFPSNCESRGATDAAADAVTDASRHRSALSGELRCRVCGRLSFASSRLGNIPRILKVIRPRDPIMSQQPYHETLPKLSFNFEKMRHVVFISKNLIGNIFFCASNSLFRLDRFC